MRTARVPVDEGVAIVAYVWDADRPAVPAFLLVHGLASNARMWDGVAGHLAHRGHTAVAVDQRGHGSSDKPDSGYDFATVTSDLVRVIDHLGLDRPVVVGQSWGGNVVLELAARRPEVVSGIGCVDGGTIELSRQFGDWDECAAALAPPTFAGVRPAALEADLRRAHPDWPEEGIRGELACFEVDDDGTVAPRLTFDRHMAILRQLWEHRPSERYAEVPVPVLLLPCETGAPRPVCPPELVDKAQATLARARTHWFRAHHDVHAQRPAEVAEVLLAAVGDGFFGPVPAAGERRR